MFLLDLSRHIKNDSFKMSHLCKGTTRERMVRRVYDMPLMLLFLISPNMLPSLRKYRVNDPIEPSPSRPFLQEAFSKNVIDYYSVVHRYEQTMTLLHFMTKLLHERKRTHTKKIFLKNIHITLRSKYGIFYNTV